MPFLSVLTVISDYTKKRVKNYESLFILLLAITLKIVYNSYSEKLISEKFTGLSLFRWSSTFSHYRTRTVLKTRKGYIMLDVKEKADMSISIARNYQDDLSFLNGVCVSSLSERLAMDYLKAEIGEKIHACFKAYSEVLASIAPESSTDFFESTKSELLEDADKEEKMMLDLFNKRQVLHSYIFPAPGEPTTEAEQAYYKFSGMVSNR